MRLEDAGDRRWRLDRVSFRVTGDLERVILELERAGSGGPTAAAIGRALPTAALRAFVRTARRPRSGRMTVGIELTDGIRTALGLRAYRPRGMRTIRELSIHRLGRDATVLIAVASDGCFRMRAAGWGRGASGGSHARIVIDVRS